MWIARFLPRWASVVALACVALSVPLAASPAQADPASDLHITISSGCDIATGTETIVYMVTNKSSQVHHLVVNAVRPSQGRLDDGQPRDLAPQAVTAYQQTIAAATSAELVLGVDNAGALVGSGVLYYSCAEAHLVTITGRAGPCDPVTGVSTITWTAMWADPDRTVQDAKPLQLSAASYLQGVNPQNVTGIEANRPVTFLQSIGPGWGTASLTLEVNLDQPSRAGQSAEVTSPGIPYNCPFPYTSTDSKYFAVAGGLGVLGAGMLVFGRRLRRRYDG